MKKIVQTTLWVFIVVFCLYYIFTNPQDPRTESYISGKIG